VKREIGSKKDGQKGKKGKQKRKKGEERGK